MATALWTASSLGQAEEVRRMTAAGADINQRGGLDAGSAPLHIAASQGHVEVVTVLLEAGAAHSAKAMDGTAPLHIAVLHPPWRQPRGKLMVSLVNSHTNATRIGWHLLEIDFRFAPGLPPGTSRPHGSRGPSACGGRGRFWQGGEGRDAAALQRSQPCHRAPAP